MENYVVSPLQFPQEHRRKPKKRFSLSKVSVTNYRISGGVPSLDELQRTTSNNPRLSELFGQLKQAGLNGCRRSSRGASRFGVNFDDINVSMSSTSSSEKENSAIRIQEIENDEEPIVMEPTNEPQIEDSPDESEDDEIDEPEVARDAEVSQDLPEQLTVPINFGKKKSLSTIFEHTHDGTEQEFVHEEEANHDSEEDELVERSGLKDGTEGDLISQDSEEESEQDAQMNESDEEKESEQEAQLNESDEEEEMDHSDDEKESEQEAQKDDSDDEQLMVTQTPIQAEEPFEPHVDEQITEKAQEKCIEKDVNDEQLEETPEPVQRKKKKNYRIPDDDEQESPKEVPKEDEIIVEPPIPPPRRVRGKRAKVEKVPSNNLDDKESQQVQETAIDNDSNHEQSEEPRKPVPKKRAKVDGIPLNMTVLDDGTRRSRRNRIAPLDYWRNERPVYRRDSTGLGTFKFVKIDEGTKAWTPKVNKKPALPGMKRKVAPSMQVIRERMDAFNLSIHDAGFEKFKTKNEKTKKKLNSQEHFIIGLTDLKFKPSKMSPGVEMAIAHKDEDGAHGYIKFASKSKKEKQKTSEYTTSFTVVFGVISVQIDDQTPVLIQTGGFLRVKPQSFYSMTNVRTDEAIVQFYVIKN